MLALRRLELDEVWWLVSPQNPLKPIAGMAPFAERLAEARRVADHPRIYVTDIEAGLGTTYTADTLPKLMHRFPGVRFVWLMGADNLVQIDRWRDWATIFNTLAIAVFDRPHYSLRALACKAARRFQKARLKESQAGALADTPPPAWVFLHTRLNATSATAIRVRRGSKPWASAQGRGRRSGLGAMRGRMKRRRTP
jgi:nicotinate-nucleotide adenylyltransferase